MSPRPWYRWRLGPFAFGLWDYPDQTRVHSNGERWFCFIPGIWFRVRRATA
jgi:hypothetical protein